MRLSKFTPIYVVLIAAIFQIHILQAQCPNGKVQVRLEIDPDADFYETYWAVVDPETLELYESNFFISALPKVYEFCVPDSNCLLFYLYDEGANGFAGGGYVRLFYNNQLVFEDPTGDFGEFKSVRIGCPIGSFCTNPYTTQLGNNSTPNGKESWYEFTPTITGKYEIATCFPDNACPTKIWVYNFCENLFVAGNQAGAIAFAEGGCNGGATLHAYLESGKQYFIRIKNRYIDCPLNQAIYFNINFLGAITGCTDPAACNYNPLATISDTCFYNGSPCLRLPDLITDEDRLRKTLKLEKLSNGDNCAIEEGCIRGFGERQLIVFDTRISNIGEEDFYLGQPPANPNDTSSQFIFDPCHNHWHYRGYAEYLLFDAAGNALPIGQKNGFCVLDLECYNGTLGKYSCENMGISANCGDIYDHTLPCQWVDITGIAPGFYTLVMRVNWDQKPDKNGRLEKNWENNWAQACFEIRETNGFIELEMINECPKFTDCAGIAFGSTTTDCEGNCGGSALFGDWDKNQLRNAVDLQAYLQNALINTPPSTCIDLFPDGKIDVYDAALLQECNIHQNNQIHWGNRYPCAFPTGTENPNDLVRIGIGKLDTLSKTLTLQITNPNQRLFGYQFRTDGLEIESIENLVGGYNASVLFEPTGGIIALSPTETPLKKHNVPTNFLRIKYKKLTEPEICLTEITAVVNEKYQKSNAQIDLPACVPADGFVSTSAPINSTQLRVLPNPMRQTATVYIENPNQDWFTAQLTDAQGRVVQQWEKIRGDSFGIAKGHLPSGIYTLALQFEKGRGIARVVIF